jgi:TetR/AcrR family transcriptional regulator, regulator of mycofactocin system
MMRAAVRLASRKGWSKTTVDEIAAAAGVSPRTFFRYFPTKVDVLFADEPERLGAIERALAERGRDETVLAAVRRGVLDFVTEFMADADVFVTRARLAFEHPDLLGHALVQFARLEARVAAAAADDLAAGEADVRPRLIGAAAAAAVRATAQTWVARGGRGDPREIVHETFDLLEDGLRI